MLDYKVNDGPSQDPPDSTQVSVDHKITVSYVDGSLQLGGDIHPTPGDPKKCDYVTDVNPGDTVTWQADQTVDITSITYKSTNVFSAGPAKKDDPKVWTGTVGSLVKKESYTIGFKSTSGVVGNYDPKIQVDS